MFHPCFLVASILSNYFIGLLATAASNGGFTVELIRPDSPKSPFYNANKTFTGRLKKYYPNALQSQVIAYKGEHLMKLTIGTPPLDIYGIADTGSDLVWTQCVPCDDCYNQISPMFDPLKSSTYNDFNCESEQCRLINTGPCSQNTCTYTYAYADYSITRGVFAQEKVTMTSNSGQTVSLDIAFGCGHNNSGFFNDHEMGIIGLGGGSVSFVSQIGSTFGSKRFSHCLLPFGADPSIASKISFGNGSEVVGDGVVSTPLVSKEDKTPYFVTLEGISVGDTYVPFNSLGMVSKGNMFLDSGTPPTIVPQDFYDRLAVEVQKQIAMNPIRDDPDLGTQLCYRTKSNLDGPILTVHFEGAKVQLKPMHTFISPKDGVYCFAMQGSIGDGIYGNFAQANFLIGFDMETMMLSFMPTDCTKQ
ncbi:aspartic proteinase CDR1-like [Castanea sativa]|uniref:aspartic proteinase CDR1-like n=1 Tax=Castanea sativa TaxID=21020 RepID=UPI003F6495F0